MITALPNRQLELLQPEPWALATEGQMPDMPRRDSIIEVLCMQSAAIHFATIARKVVAERLRTAVGATFTHRSRSAVR